MRSLIEEKLKKELKYSEYTAKRTAEDLVGIMSPDIHTAINVWLKSGDEPCVIEDDISTQELMQDYGLTYPAALIFIDWMREDVRTALLSLRKRQ